MVSKAWIEKQKEKSVGRKKLKEKGKVKIGERTNRAKLRNLLEELSGKKIPRTTKKATIEKRLPKEIEKAAKRINDHYRDMGLKTRIRPDILMERQGIEAASKQLVKAEEKTKEIKNRYERVNKLQEAQGFTMSPLKEIYKEFEFNPKKVSRKLAKVEKDILTAHPELEEKISSKTTPHKIRVAKGSVPEEVLKEMKKEKTTDKIKNKLKQEFPRAFETKTYKKGKELIEEVKEKIKEPEDEWEWQESRKVKKELRKLRKEGYDLETPFNRVPIKGKKASALLSKYEAAELKAKEKKKIGKVKFGGGGISFGGGIGNVDYLKIAIFLFILFTFFALIAAIF